MFPFEGLLAEQVRTEKTWVPVLVVDDDRSLLPVFDRIVASLDPPVAYHWCSSLEQARASLRHNRYSLILADFLLEGGGSGLDLLELNSASPEPAEFVLMSGLKLERFCRFRFDDSGAPRILEKPLDPGTLGKIIHDAVWKPA